MRAKNSDLLLTPAQQRKLSRDMQRDSFKREKANLLMPHDGRNPQFAVNMFLDSGVFGAWIRNKELDLDKYCDYIKRNEHVIEAYAGMDVIPGKMGVRRTMDEVEDSAMRSRQNQLYMKERGLKPVPIFHQGESFKWLELMLRDGETYIGISTAKDLTQREHREWLDIVFTMLTDIKGVPYVRTHGFGVTTIPLLMRYPWYTSDSTTWSLAPAYGLIYVPGWSRGAPDYTRLPQRIIMSGRQQEAWSSARRQYENATPIEKDHIDAWLKHCGITIEEARYDSNKRRVAVLKYFVEFHRNMRLKPFAFRQGTTHAKAIPHDAKAKGLWDTMTIMFATIMDNSQFSRIMTKADVRNRLISYHETMDKPDDVFQNYVKIGTTNLEYERRKPAPVWNDSYTSQRRFQLLERIKEGQTDGTNEAD